MVDWTELRHKQTYRQAYSIRIDTDKQTDGDIGTDTDKQTDGDTET